MEAFVYCWTDYKTKKLYVGSHKGNPDDGYVCSSKYMLQEYKSRPQDFTRQIVAIGKFEDIRRLEEHILHSADAKNSNDFYNQHNGNKDFRLKFHTEKTKKIISEKNQGKKRPDLAQRNKLGHSEQTKSKISENHHDVNGENNPMYGKKHSPETIEKNKKNRIGKGKQLKSEETKQKMSLARKQYWNKRKGNLT
jgi:hypothetical protein